MATLSRVVSQCQVERQVLQHVKDALRLTLNWEVNQIGLPRKLSSVRFTAQSFRRHFERLMAIEEENGYMANIAEQKPQLAERIEALRTDHDHFRTQLARLMPELESAELDADHFQQLCYEFQALLDRFEQHDAGELAIFQEAWWEDEGGEG